MTYSRTEVKIFEEKNIWLNILFKMPRAVILEKIIIVKKQQLSINGTFSVTQTSLMNFDFLLTVSKEGQRFGSCFYHASSIIIFAICYCFQVY